MKYDGGFLYREICVNVGSICVKKFIVEICVTESISRGKSETCSLYDMWNFYILIVWFRLINRTSHQNINRRNKFAEDTFMHVS